VKLTPEHEKSVRCNQFRDRKETKEVYSLKSKKRLLWEYIEAILTALILALIIRAYIIQAFKIPSGSMIPTLLIGDHILVNKFIYGTTIPLTDKKILIWENPEKGDIIVSNIRRTQKRIS
jgi:signal peptidase I